MPVLQIIFHTGFPAVALYLCRKFKILDFFSPVALCYVAGAVIANLPGVPYNRDLARTILEAVLPLAIVLLLFSANFRAWLSHSKTTIMAFGFQIISVMTASTFIVFVFAGFLNEEPYKIAGMMTGVYSGTTANMFGVGKALGADENSMLLLSASDLIAGAVYFLLLLLVAVPLYRRFLPAYVYTSEEKEDESVQKERQKYIDVWPFTAAILLAILITGASVALSLIITSEISAPVIFISVTTFAIIAGLFEKVRKVRGTYPVGNYLILIFCFGLGSLADIQSFASEVSVYFYVVVFTLLLTVLIHLLLCTLFRIDSDTVIITSCAGIYGPPFVPAIVRAMKNREILVAGMTTSLIGLALGNYLGLAGAYLYKFILG